MQSSTQIVTTNKPTPSVFTGRMPFLSPNQQCQSTKGKYHISSTCFPQTHLGVFQHLSLTTNSSWLPWGRFAVPLVSPLMPVPILQACRVQYQNRTLPAIGIQWKLAYSGGLTSSKWTGCEVWCYGVKKWLSGLLKLQHSIKICCICSTTWNSLPTHLRRVENSTAAFGWSLKTHLFSEY